MAEDMKINPQRAKQLAENIASITSRINAANKSGRQVNPHHHHTSNSAGLVLTILVEGAVNSSIKAQTRLRHPVPPPTAIRILFATIPFPFRRKLRAGVDRKVEIATAVDTVAFHRRFAIE
jgi:hypothetical protein